MSRKSLTKNKEDNKSLYSLPEPSDKIERYKEIAIKYPQNLAQLFNKLNRHEKIFFYFMYRALLPGNLILTDQFHRNGPEITKLFETILANKDKLDQKKYPEYNKLFEEIELFLVYLWTNQSQYFKRDSAQNKRTPENLGAKYLNKNSLIQILEELNIPDARLTVERLDKVIFDSKYETTHVVPGSIDLSSVNIYSHDFTDKDYKEVPASKRIGVNHYFFIETKNNKRTAKTTVYSAENRCDKEITVIVYWLEKAYKHVKEHPQYFDNYLINSLKYLIKFFKTGKDEYFKKHSNQWRQICCTKVDYTMGFIEVYNDPKSGTAFFEGEVTIKVINLEELCSILPGIELELPVPKQFKRDNLETGTAPIPNASINQQVFGSGDLGPLKNVAAYCLPNYEDLKELGSKQIIYPSEKSLGATLNPKLSRQISFTTDQVEWLEKNDPNQELTLDLWDISSILHETIGHASGKLAFHTFQEDQNLTVQGVTYNIGDTIPVTSVNIKELLTGFKSTLEELRAEIIALYVSVNHVEQLAKKNLLKDWPSKISKKELIEWFIICMARTGLYRLGNQPDGAVIVSGDHARANYVILNYLIDKKGIELVKETKNIDNKQYQVLSVRIKHLDKALDAIKELLILVQYIKSTADIKACANLINTYGINITDPEQVTIVKNNSKILAGDVKVYSYIYPFLDPVKDESGNIIDIKSSWPKDIFEQFKKYSELSLSLE